MFKRIREYWRDYKAWKRGERRVAPYGARGRIYEKIDGSDGATRVDTKTVFQIKARVIRADGRPDEYYNLTEGK